MRRQAIREMDQFPSAASSAATHSKAEGTSTSYKRTFGESGDMKAVVVQKLTLQFCSSNK